VMPRSSEMTCHEELYHLTLTLTMTARNKCCNREDNYYWVQICDILKSLWTNGSYRLCSASNCNAI